MKKKIIIGIVFLVIILIIGFSILKNTNVKDISSPLSGMQKFASKIGVFPKCPADLSGILTHPLMPLEHIAALTPLGNINPPGHTSPVDHIYFQTNSDGKIPMGAPADAIINQIMTISREESPGNYVVHEYNLKFVLCDGLELDLVNYNDVVDKIKSEIEKRGEKECKSGIVKDGHGGKAEGQCYYDVNIPVQAGEQVGWLWRVPHPEDSSPTLPFEIWAANYNVAPPSQTNWEYYNDDRYAHIMCPFDLYAGDLKKQFEEKFGRWQYEANEVNGKKIVNYNSGIFIPRNGEPKCGQVDQDLTGTIQGMWFSKPTPKDDDNVKFNGGLAFVHDNIDVNMGVISVGGDLVEDKAGVISFKPLHLGTIDREPSEVKADGSLYCYRTNGQWGENKKFLVQLVDDHHLKAEIQNGTCESANSFSQPFSYER